MNDATIIAGLKAGNDNVIGDIYKLYHGYLIRFLSKNGCEHNDAEDIIQETIIAFVKSVKNNAFKEESSIKSFLSAIAKRQFWSALKKFKSTSELTDNEKDIAEQYEMDEDYEIELIIEQETKAMGDPCTTLLISNIAEGQALQEVAEKLGYTYDFVRKKKGRCKKTLRERLLKHEIIRRRYGRD